MTRPMAMLERINKTNNCPPANLVGLRMLSHEILGPNSVCSATTFDNCVCFCDCNCECTQSQIRGNAPASAARAL